jgi:hypothetical protein
MPVPATKTTRICVDSLEAVAGERRAVGGHAGLALDQGEGHTLAQAVERRIDRSEYDRIAREGAIAHSQRSGKAGWRLVDDGVAEQLGRTGQEHLV